LFIEVKRNIIFKGRKEMQEVKIHARTEIGRITNPETNETEIQYAGLSTVVNLPDSLEEYVGIIGEGKVFGYVSQAVQRRGTDLLRVALKKEIKDAEEENREGDLNNITIPFTSENWVKALDEQRATGGKLGKAVRAATQIERDNAIAGLKMSLVAVGREIDSLTEDEKVKINEAYGYRVFS
jgi:hypothetical protein